MKKIIPVFVIILTVMFPLGLMESCDTTGVDTVNGKMMFWSDFDGPPIDVYIDNNFSGTIDQYFNKTPDCGSDGCVTVTLDPGSYSFHAEEHPGPGSTGQTWDKTVTIVANSCGALELTANAQQMIQGTAPMICNAGYIN